MATIRVRCNGRNLVLPATTTVADLIRKQERMPHVVVRNGYPLPKTDWDQPLRDRDRIALIRHDEAPDESAFYDLLTARNTPALQEHIQSATVGIAGCGGLGSHVAVALARTGIGALTLADFDVVEPSNLNRQCYDRSDIGRPKVAALRNRIHRFNPFIRIHTRPQRLTPDNLAESFAGCQVVVEAFDTVESKAMIVQAFSRPPLNHTPLVTASGLAGIADPNRIRTRRLTENILVCGDLSTGASEGTGLMAPRVMVAAGHQATTVLRLLACISIQ